MPVKITTVPQAKKFRELKAGEFVRFKWDDEDGVDVRTDCNTTGKKVLNLTDGTLYGDGTIDDDEVIVFPPGTTFSIVADDS